MSVSTLAYGTAPTVTNVGSPTAVQLAIAWPAGKPGTDGLPGSTGNTGPRGFQGDSLRHYNGSGVITGRLKYWTGTVVPTTASGQSIDISSAGFSSIQSVQVIAMRNTTDAMLVPNVAIKSQTTSAITVNITQPNNATVAILGINVLSGGPSVFATSLSSVSLSVTVIGL